MLHILQQWTLNGTQIINKNNSFCLSAGPQPCGVWSDCNKSQAQTRQSNYILNVFVEQCNPSDASQQWSLGAAPNASFYDFTPLNVSSAEFPPPVPGLAAQVSLNSPQVSLTWAPASSALNFCGPSKVGLCSQWLFSPVIAPLVHG